MIEELIGKIIKCIKIPNDNTRIIFSCIDGTTFEMYHEQEGFECVTIDSICGNLKNLIGHPILSAEKVNHYNKTPYNLERPKQYYEGEDMSYTWTFCKLSTIKGRVTIRWFGDPNGNYFESGFFERMKDEQ